MLAPDYQVLFNIALTLIGVLGGVVLNNIRESIKSIKDDHKVTNETVHRMEVLVAGEYVKKDDLEKLTNALMTQLTRIENKVDAKADKA